MKTQSIIRILLFILILAGMTHPDDSMNSMALMPKPAKMEFSAEKFRLAESFTVSVSESASPRMCRGVTRALRRLAGRTGLFFPQDIILPTTQKNDAGLFVRAERAGKISLGENEAYLLKITPDKMELTAETDIGVLRGLETLLQLLSADESGYYFPAALIEDEPRFPWRGLLIDAGRHFMPVDVIKRNLDGMAAVKMNVMHWHLTEDQGFRIECKTWPKLHEMGSDGFYYTHEQIKEIIDYAADRGIRVMPEFDMPGHTTSWFVGYPELASAPGPYTIERKWGIMDPAMNPTLEETYQFLDAFYKEMAKLFPDEYFHIGGDENNGKHWNANTQIQAYMKKNNIADNHALQSYFNNRLLKILTKYGKKMVGWDEILHPAMPTNIVIQSWRGREALIKSAQQGYRGILSNGYYIDLIQPTDFHYLNDPLAADAPLNDQEKQRILGGEATMWSEYVSPETIDSRIWPRTAAIAERFWSPSDVKDVDDMYQRMEVISGQLEEHGLTHEKNYGMMLRRLCNGKEITPLKNFVDVIEPVKIYRRGSLREHTSYSPLTRVIDAARPDAKIAREFRKMVAEYLVSEKKDDGQYQAIRQWLELWQQNHAELEKIIEVSPTLKEIETLSADLQKLAEIGLQGVEAVHTGKSQPKEWIQQQLEYLETTRKPRGQTELMIVPAIEKLLKAI